MAVTKTRTDLILSVLEDLGVAAIGQPPEIEDRARVDNNLDAVLAELPAREICDVPDHDNIPLELFNSLSAIVAWELRDKFGITGQGRVELETRNAEAVEKIRRMTRVRPTRAPLIASYI